MENLTTVFEDKLNFFTSIEEAEPVQIMKHHYPGRDGSICFTLEGTIGAFLEACPVLTLAI